MTSDLNSLVQNHTRNFGDQQYVYPVISRRSRGVSIGINISPTALCNFRCVYCQVVGKKRIASTASCDEVLPDAKRSLEIDLAVLEYELRRTLALAIGGELFQFGHFAKTPSSLRRINDIAFSGNGEPTLSPQFADAARIVIKVRDELGAFGVKPVVITNATRFHEPEVREALDWITASGGEIWAKLDAGTQSYYEQVDRSRVPFQTIIDNLASAAGRSPIVIQTLFFNMHGQSTPEAQWRAYIDRLNDIGRQGGQIKLVQLYTVARATAELWVAPLADHELNALADHIRNETGLTVDTFYGG